MRTKKFVGAVATAAVCIGMVAGSANAAVFDITVPDFGFEAGGGSTENSVQWGLAPTGGTAWYSGHYFDPDNVSTRTWEADWNSGYDMIFYPDDDGNGYPAGATEGTNTYSVTSEETSKIQNPQNPDTMKE